MKHLLLVGFGGFAGSICRYLMSIYALRLFPFQILTGTLLVNLLGSLLIGLISGSLLKPATQPYQLLLITGFCGGFTTFSSFSLEGLKMLKAAQYGLYAGYTTLSVVGGLLLCLAGVWLAHKMIG